MSSLTFVRYLVECDGCGAIFGGREGFESLTESRAAAYGAGWRFPHQVTAKGASTRNTSDVCGRCVPEWKPQRAGEKTRHMRMLSTAEVAKL